MAFKLSYKGFVQDIITDNDEFRGVKKAAGWLAKDIGRVSGTDAKVIEKTYTPGLKGIIAGTLGKSELIEKACEEYKLDVSKIFGKREVYGIFVTDDAVIVAGSEKRGTIYGLLHISECIGVTPFVYFGDTVPVKYESIFIYTATEEENVTLDPKALYASAEGISNEPSVRYRGFFINDEWPAFGNWCNRHFNGFTAECYENVFEYLLRLKGNYMWPAMWSSIFSADGPGLKSAELADELGVVMGTSHHEPCCRAGEEFQKLKKTHPEYGVDWSFVKNREGVTRFWEDGLKRSGGFENVITVGMRGEADSKLFADATLEDNINVLKDVINCQKELINKYTDGKQPLMLAVYKEVEEYYKGNDVTTGLKDWDGLDGITLMLCDDNFGNLRLMMDDDKRDHNGGYGMYYHFDYHGGPVSYEWINSSYLPKIWEQMTTAYDFGIRDIWIVNVGDLKNQEIPLNYFMDLAYDFEKYGTSAKGNYVTYLKEWVDKQFAGLDSNIRELILEVADGYMRLNNIVKPEVISEGTYSINHYNEAGRVLDIVSELEKKAEAVAAIAGQEQYVPYMSLVGYQALAAFNLIKMQIFAGYNKKYAAQGRVIANKYADLVKACIEKDRRIIEEFHTMNGEKWFGMGMSKHIGFRAWNEEGCRLPVMVYVEPESKNDVIIADDDSDLFSGAGDWTKHPVRLTGFDYRGKGSFTVSSSGKNPITYTIDCEDKDIRFSGKDNRYVLSGIADSDTDAHITVYAAEDAAPGRHEFSVKTNIGTVKIYFELKGSPVIYGVNAEEYYKLTDSEEGAFSEIEDFGRLLPGEKHSALKTFPQDKYFVKGPKAEYRVDIDTAGKYKLIVYTAPSNPSSQDNRIPFSLEINGSEPMIINTVPSGFAGGENSCRDWCIAVLENVRRTEIETELKEGGNTFVFGALKPGFVLERFEIIKDEVKVPYSRLGCL
ncbi:MAG: glycosyl hydrolase 115 family protein [Lachnospiraceae bacterium]|nr:glycosyl hydrolase 115 family protein [Lachnospiraceae bacterium]